MKKIIYGTLFLALVGIIFVGCEKVEVESMVQPVENHLLKEQAPWGMNRHWDVTKGDCFIPAETCYDDLPIDANSSAVLEFENAIINGGISIKNYFNSSAYLVLFPDFNDENLAKLQSGNYAALKVTNANKSFFLFGEATNLTTSNPEFVLVLDNN